MKLETIEEKENKRKFMTKEFPVISNRKSSSF